MAHDIARTDALRAWREGIFREHGERQPDFILIRRFLQDGID